MSEKTVPTQLVISKLDNFLAKNDYESAKNHLLKWLSTAQQMDDKKSELFISNELMGLFRKLGDKENALKYAQNALDTVERLGISQNVGAATTYLNTATVYKAFSMAERSLPLFERALEIYEKNLNKTALTLVDLGEFNRADSLFKKAIDVMSKNRGKEGEVAITYLNMASAAEKQYGLENGEKTIAENIEKAMALLDLCEDKESGNYAFICEKCATVFGYYGYFVYENELKKRYKKIYEGS